MSLSSTIIDVPNGQSVPIRVTTTTTTTTLRAYVRPVESAHVQANLTLVGTATGGAAGDYTIACDFQTGVDLGEHYFFVYDAASTPTAASAVVYPNDTGGFEDDGEQTILRIHQAAYPAT